MRHRVLVQRFNQSASFCRIDGLVPDLRSSSSKNTSPSGFSAFSWSTDLRAKTLLRSAAAAREPAPERGGGAAGRRRRAVGGGGGGGGAGAAADLLVAAGRGDRECQTQMRAWKRVDGRESSCTPRWSQLTEIDSHCQ